MVIVSLLPAALEPGTTISEAGAPAGGSEKGMKLR
jgi:hypothetical protein